MKLDNTANERGSTTVDGANERESSVEKGFLGDSSNGMNTHITVTDVDEHPSVVRRTVIVVGVALGLFLVRRDVGYQSRRNNAHSE